MPDPFSIFISLETDSLLYNDVEIEGIRSLSNEGAKILLAGCRAAIDILDDSALDNWPPSSEAGIDIRRQRSVVTSVVGILKAVHGFPARDTVREAEQLERLDGEAVKRGLNSGAVRSYMTGVLGSTVATHGLIKAELDRRLTA